MKNSNRYDLIQISNLETTNPIYKLAEEVRDSFRGVSKNLFNNIKVKRDSSCNHIVFYLDENCDYCFEIYFRFFSFSRFTYTPENKEPWDLQIDSNGNFGRGFSIQAKIPRLCVLGMIREKQKRLEEELKSLNKFKKFEDYTYMRHVFC